MDEQQRQRIVAGERVLAEAWRSLAGADLDRMLESQERAREYLSHPNPKLRNVALSVLTRYFGLWDETEAECVRLASSDPDLKIQLLAKLALITCYRKKKDPRAKRLLAEIVRDASQSDDVRLSCYSLLMGLLGKPTGIGPARFPDDIDWMVVEQAERAKE